jgi:hypothetical protein
MKTMDIRALLVINSRDVAGDSRVALTGPPLALLDVAGKSPLQRIIEHLEQAGISYITAVIDAHPFSSPGRAAFAGRVDCRASASERLWRTCEDVLHELVENGAELVLIIRLGPYVEIDLEQLVQFHMQRPRRVSHVVHEAHVPEVFCISASQRNDAACLFRNELSQRFGESSGCLHTGYTNPLSDARDLRQFAVDVLTLKTKTRPAGREVKPGVWIARGAVIEKGSRILGPAFIGASARIGASVVVTRCTAIEHDAYIDCGTVVENSTVLPYTYVGAGLDVAHSVVGMGQIANLRQNATVAVFDRKLVGQVSSGAGRKLVRTATVVVSSIGRVIQQGLFGDARERRYDLEPAPQNTTALEESQGHPEPAQAANADGESPSRLAVARKLGGQ